MVRFVTGKPQVPQNLPPHTNVKSRSECTSAPHSSHLRRHVSLHPHFVSISPPINPPAHPKKSETEKTGTTTATDAPVGTEIAPLSPPSSTSAPACPQMARAPCRLRDGDNDYDSANLLARRNLKGSHLKATTQNGSVSTQSTVPDLNQKDNMR